jgi:hypothetical protein
MKHHCPMCGEQWNEVRVNGVTELQGSQVYSSLIMQGSHVYSSLEEDVYGPSDDY